MRGLVFEQCTEEDSAEHQTINMRTDSFNQDKLSSSLSQSPKIGTK